MVGTKAFDVSLRHLRASDSGADPDLLDCKPLGRQIRRQAPPADPILHAVLGRTDDETPFGFLEEVFVLREMSIAPRYAG